MLLHQDAFLSGIDGLLVNVWSPTNYCSRQCILTVTGVYTFFVPVYGLQWEMIMLTFF